MTVSGWARSVGVAPERLARWLDGFTGRHPHTEVEVTDAAVTLAAPDGAGARIRLVWGPLPVTGDPLRDLVSACSRPRRVGALIVRRRAHAVGVFEGAQLLDGRHGSHYVQGRTKAGGWSQQRYARRRSAQAERSFAAAAEDAVAVLLPERDRLEALVTGGERAAVAAVLAHPGLDALARLAEDSRFGVLPVPDPNAGVLAGFATLFRTVRIELNDLA